MRNFFLQVINKKHKNMIFLIEAEINGSLSFLDIKLFAENEKFLLVFSEKNAFSGARANFIRFVPLDYRLGFYHTL